MSRRARGFAVWAVLKALGRAGARRDGRAALRGRRGTSPGGSAAEPGLAVLNEVVLNQVAVACGDGTEARRADEGDARGGAGGRGLLSDGGRWRGREIIRVSVSAGPTTIADGTRSAEAIVAAWRRARGAA